MPTPAGANSGWANRKAQANSRRLGQQTRPEHVGCREARRNLRSTNTEAMPMTEQAVTFPSAGLKLSGVVHVPRGLKPSERRGAFLVLHGFGSNKTSSNTMAPTKVLSDLGYVVLRFDMRGCGDSEGEFGRVICLDDGVCGQSARRRLLSLHAANDSFPPTEQSTELFKRAGHPTELPPTSDADLFMFGEGNPRVWDLRRGWLADFFPATAAIAPK